MFDMEKVVNFLNKYFPIILNLILSVQIKNKFEKNKLFSEILLNEGKVHEMEKNGSLTKKQAKNWRKIFQDLKTFKKN